MINDLFDFREENFGDLAIRAKNLYCRFAERLCAAQVIDSPTHAVPIQGDNFDVIAFEHLLQFSNNREEIVHRITSFLKNHSFLSSQMIPNN